MSTRIETRPSTIGVRNAFRTLIHIIFSFFVEQNILNRTERRGGFETLGFAWAEGVFEACGLWPVARVFRGPWPGYLEARGPDI